MSVQEEGFKVERGGVGGFLREERVRRVKGGEDRGGGKGGHPSLLLHHHWSTTYCAQPGRVSGVHV